MTFGLIGIFFHSEKFPGKTFFFDREVFILDITAVDYCSCKVTI